MDPIPTGTTINFTMPAEYAPTNPYIIVGVALSALAIGAAASYYLRPEVKMPAIPDESFMKVQDHVYKWNNVLFVSNKTVLLGLTGSFNDVTYLKMSNCAGITQANIDTICTALPHLKTIEPADGGAFSELVSHDDVHIIGGTAIPADLRFEKVEANVYKAGNILSVRQDVALLSLKGSQIGPYEDVTYLRISGCNDISQEDINTICDANTNIKTIELMGSTLVGSITREGVVIIGRTSISSLSSGRATLPSAPSSIGVGDDEHESSFVGDEDEDDE